MRNLITTLVCATALFAADVPRQSQRFLLPDVKGQDHDSNDLYRGKVVVLEFMQTSCPHCAAFTPVAKDIQAKYGDRVIVIGVVNPPATPAQISDFIRDHKITYPVLLDAGRVAYAYIRKPSFDIPYVFLIDTAGKIREEFEYGRAPFEIFEGRGLFRYIDDVLGAGTGAPAGKKN